MGLNVKDRTPEGFFTAARMQRGVKDTPANRKLCRDVIDWCQANEDYMLTLKQSYGANREGFLKHALKDYKEQKYGSIWMALAFQLVWMLVKMWIEAYFTAEQ